VVPSGKIAQQRGYGFNIELRFPVKPEAVANRAAGYRLVTGELKNQEWVSPTLNTTADGSLSFPVLDLAKWDDAEAFKPGADVDGDEAQRRHQPNREGYGFGWFTPDVRGHRLLEHEGEWQGFTGNISRYVDDEWTIVVLTNLAGAKPQEISHPVAGLYVKDWGPPSSSAPK